MPDTDENAHTRIDHVSSRVGATTHATFSCAPLDFLSTVQLLPAINGSSADLTLHQRAEVIKIEHPTRGDDTRAWGPPYAKYLDRR